MYVKLSYRKKVTKSVRVRVRAGVEYGGEFASVQTFAREQLGIEKIHISPLASLLVIVSALTISITWSLIAPKGAAPAEHGET